MIFVADISSNWNGKFEDAKKIMKDLKESSGNNQVIAKFQYWNTEKFINKKEFDKMSKISHQKNWNDSVYNTYLKYQLPIEYIQELSNYAKEINIGFMVSCYDFESLDKINNFVDIYKIGSGDITYHDILIKTANYGKPIILSTGASTIEEVITAVNVIEKTGNKNIVLMQCITDYTNNPDNLKYSCINVLKSYKTYFPRYSIGLSDHSNSNIPAILATAFDCQFIEKHFKGSIKTDSPDSNFSLDIPNWKYFISQVNESEKILGNIYKTIMPNEIDTRIIQRRCWYATKDMIKGHVITKNDFIAMRPAPPPDKFTPMVNLVGVKLKKDIKKHEAFSFQNVEIKDK